MNLFYFAISQGFWARRTSIKFSFTKGKRIDQLKATLLRLLVVFREPFLVP